MNKRNYQRELDALIKSLEEKKETPRFVSFIAVARHALAMYWNTWQNILKLLYIFIIPIFLQEKSMKKE